MATARSGPHVREGDLSFELRGLSDRIHCRSPAPPEWVVKSVRYGGQERINIPTEFKSQCRDPSALEIVLTNRPPGSIARVIDEKGQPMEDARVLLFPADPTSMGRQRATSVWRFGLPREGTYEFAGLRPAEYLLAVLPDGRLSRITTAGRWKSCRNTPNGSRCSRMIRGRVELTIRR